MQHQKFNSEDQNRKNIKKIAGEMIKRKKFDANKFIFIIGAGCSFSAGIPLGNTIANEIKNKAEFKTSLQDIEDLENAQYMELMSHLTISERKQILEPHLKKAEMNWAHLAIANLISHNYVDRVLTFNFDNLLTRACGMCSVYPATYDYALGASDSSRHLNKPAIIHLHGQGYGQKQINSDEETKHHTNNLKQLFINSFDMAPVIVIGYSGENDANFKTLVSAYSGMNRIYWIGHSPKAGTHIEEFINKYPKFIQYIGGADADEFLCDLADHVDSNQSNKEESCWPPAIIDKPLLHLRKETKDLIEFPLGNNTTDLTKVMNETYTFLDAALQNENPQKAGEEPFNALNAFLKKEYEKIIAQYEKHGEKSVNDDIISATFFNEGYKLHKKANMIGDADFYDEAIEKYQKAIEIDPEFVHAYSNWGNILCEKARLADEPNLYDEAIEKYQKAIEINPDYAHAYYNWLGNLIEKFLLTKDEDLLKKARKIREKYLELDPKNRYNLACLEALDSKPEAAREYLIYCEEHNSLPSKEYIENDEDLVCLRELDWFKELLARMD